MLKHQITIHQAQINKAKEIFKDKLSPQALMIINNMQSIIDKLLKENEELESIIAEESQNMVGRL